MPPLTDVELAELEQLVTMVTPGEWEAVGAAATRNTLPRLLVEVKELRRENARLKSLLERDDPNELGD